jgi:hypothetical protein
MAKQESLFGAGKAKWLLENARKLSPDQRALLLAMADLDVQAGHIITPEDRAALDELAAQAEGYDPSEIERAMKHMVEAKPTHQTLEWPDDLAHKKKK